MQLHTKETPGRSTALTEHVETHADRWARQLGKDAPEINLQIWGSANG